MHGPLAAATLMSVVGVMFSLGAAPGYCETEQSRSAVVPRTEAEARAGERMGGNIRYATTRSLLYGDPSIFLRAVDVWKRFTPEIRFGVAVRVIEAYKTENRTPPGSGCFESLWCRLAWSLEKLVGSNRESLLSRGQSLPRKQQLELAQVELEAARRRAMDNPRRCSGMQPSTSATDLSTMKNRVFDIGAIEFFIKLRQFCLFGKSVPEVEHDLGVTLKGNNPGYRSVFFGGGLASHTFRFAVDDDDRIWAVSVFVSD